MKKRPYTKYKLKLAEQCKSIEGLHKLQCQRVFGHKGLHWCYRGDGWLLEWRNLKDPTVEWEARTIPPSHKCYVHPKERMKECVGNFDKISRIGRKREKEKIK
jgi:hypothetical protein